MASNPSIEFKQLIFRFLLTPNVNVFVARDKGGRSLLHNAVLFGHVPVVKFLVEQHHHLVNSRDNVSHRSQKLLNCGPQISGAPPNGHAGRGGGVRGKGTLRRTTDILF